MVRNELKGLENGTKRFKKVVRNELRVAQNESR